MGKDIRDRHHVLEVFGAMNGCNAKQMIAIAEKYPMRSAAIVISGITLPPVWNDAARTGEKMLPASQQIGLVRCVAEGPSAALAYAPTY